ncbi:MAG: alpha/beta hydrolase fold-domain-containing protein [Olpidium bornovanus]|uniref:Alpha/beta hydrolase fold-domain-containing protein n=1 Tax=Olpidium bornovanus TaxID=278681 RepID=A0A8H7ZYQ0_9FUNG|nr:MAG: alpha/beta hydrolase fold-domain-containing protein [Olpidium bornovanus]
MQAAAWSRRVGGGIRALPGGRHGGHESKTGVARRHPRWGAGTRIPAPADSAGPQTSGANHPPTPTRRRREKRQGRGVRPDEMGLSTVLARAMQSFLPVFFWFRPRKRLLPEYAPDERSITVPTTFGPVNCKVYFPPATEHRQPPPVLVNFHGGGFVFGDPDQDDHLCRFLCVRAGITVLNVDYYLAPQHPYPVAPLQSFEVVCWVAENGGAANGWNGGRLAVSGHSAGGNIAAVVSRLARDNGGPKISLQVLSYPVLDLVTPVELKRQRLAKPLVPPWMARMFNNAYIPERERRGEWMASPAFEDNARNLEGVAPAVVIVSELDFLRDEAEKYASSLRAAGVLREQRVVVGYDHGYVNTHPDPPDILEVYEAAATHLKVLHQDSDQVAENQVSDVPAKTPDRA